MSCGQGMDAKNLYRLCSISLNLKKKSIFLQVQRVLGAKASDGEKREG